MPWLTTPDETNGKVLDEERVDSEPLTYYFAATNTQITKYRDSTIKQYRYVGLTYDAAVTKQAAINRPATFADPSSLIAVVRRESVAGSYCVECTETTKGAWA